MEITTMNHAMQIHAQRIKSGTDQNTPALAKLLTFSALSISGNLQYAHSIFNSLHNPNIYLWNTMLRGYARSKNPRETLFFFLTMHQKGVKPDNFTFPFLIKSCSHMQSTQEGKQIQALVFKTGLDSDPFIQNSLIHMYSCCHEMGLARKLFDKMPERDVVSWTSIIDGYVDCSLSTEALKLFGEMEKKGFDPNEATLVSVLRACADTGALSIGQKVNQIINKKKLDSKSNIVTALIDMYAKCGSVEIARELFDKMLNKDVFVCTAMISGLASNGLCEEALDLFAQMQELHIKPDGMTITAILSAFRYGSRVSEARYFFNNIEKDYRIKPRIQHYGCMVDLLARAGRLDEAEEFIKAMPVKPDAILWRSFIWACKIHGEIDRGERLVNQHLFESDKKNSANYVLLGNFYASAGKWHEKARVRELMIHQKIKKPPGRSLIEIDGIVHEFAAGDSNHPEARKIYSKWEEIAERLRLEGYQPKTLEVALDIENGEKEVALGHHSEKLAVSFGLISKSPGSKILVVKNLRSCKDCHSAMKFVSKIFDQEIIIRDRVRFHHFKNGCCSCNDYW